MASDENVERKFVGREAELALFREMLKDPYGDKRIILVLGDGGIGKTYLVREMLLEAKKQGILVPDVPIDLFSTDYRHIDGIQWRIKGLIEELLAQQKRPSPFVEWIKGKTDTSERFYELLKGFCEQNPLVLAFDTFENLDKVASDWLFKGGTDGLQVPGLICIIAGRDKEKEGIENYRKNPLVNEAYISGFTYQQAEGFYGKILEENKVRNSQTQEEKDPYYDLLRAAGLSEEYSGENGIDWVWKITSGHPLRLEMVFQWLGTLLGDESLKDITVDKFDERLMAQVRELAERGQLDAGAGKKISQPVYDTLLCMAHVIRRFDEGFLQHLIGKDLIQLRDASVEQVEIIRTLEKYFFVKIRKDRPDHEVIQLHDEMARLVRDYIWPFLDNSFARKKALLEAVEEYYERLIADQTGEEKDTLRVEKLYYTFQRDWSEGLRCWFDLAEEGNENINKLLPGEIRKYLDPRYHENITLARVQSKIADMERNAGHIKQAIGHWEKVKELGEATQHNEWVVDALIGMFNCKWTTEPKQALEMYLRPAQVLCEQYFPEKLPFVYYEIGFAHRQLQDFRQAVHLYEKAILKVQEFPDDPALEGILFNDTGYAYLNLGRWGEAAKYLSEALDVRLQQLHLARIRLRDASPSNLTRLNAAKNQAALFVGLSRNTLGEYHRYVDELEEALKDYDEAYALFDEVNDYYWQAKCLCARGETYRRLAWQAWEQDRESFIILRFSEQAHADIDKSLYLCEKYQLDDERDTAYRRHGRLSHDLALMAQSRGDMEKAQELLEEGYQYFKRGLEFAQKTKETLEELENLTELAFLADDSVSIYGKEEIPEYYRRAVAELEDALKKHGEDPQRIYQYPVFEAMLKMEQAAIAYAEGEYQKALDGYVEGYKTLGTFPGYGHARYKQHFGYLLKQVAGLPSREEQIHWRNTFRDVWRNTLMPDREGKTLEDDLLPDLIKECNKLIKGLDNK